MPIDRVFPFGEVAAVHAYAEQERPFGRVIVTP